MYLIAGGEEVSVSFENVSLGGLATCQGRLHSQNKLGNTQTRLHKERKKWKTISKLSGKRWEDRESGYGSSWGE